MNDRYKINFVEKSICVKKDIIRQIPYFNNMIKGCETDFEEIDVPRTGFLFDHVLAFVLSPLYPYPVEYYDELDFYDIFDDDQDTNKESVGQEYDGNDDNQNMNEESVRREYDGNEKQNYYPENTGPYFPSITIFLIFL